MTAPARLRIAFARSRNRWYDARAVAAGYCNTRSQPTGVPDEGSGYLHWRCALRRRHVGLHREGNYVWGPGMRATYVPAPPGTDREAWQPTGWARSMTPTMRQARNRRRWMAAQTAASLARAQDRGPS